MIWIKLAKSLLQLMNAAQITPPAEHFRDVFEVGDRCEMVWVDAEPPPACVVDAERAQILGEAPGRFPGNSMGETVGRAAADEAVAGSLRTGPNPAAKGILRIDGAAGAEDV